MKKLITLFIAAVLFCCVTGCSRYEVLLADTSDGAGPGVYSEKDINVNGRKYTDETAEKTITVECLGYTLEGEYSYSMVFPGCSYTVHGYNSPNYKEHPYSFEVIAGTHEVSFMTMPDYSDDDNALPIKKSERDKIASDFAANFIDPEQYYQYEIHSENTDWYYYYFEKMVYGVSTAEQFYVCVSRNGEIVNYRYTMLGKFSEETTPQFDVDKCEELALEKARNNYSQLKATGSDVKLLDCKISNTDSMKTKYMMTENGEIVLSCTVICTFEKMGFEYNELLQYVIRQK